MCLCLWLRGMLSVKKGIACFHYPRQAVQMKCIIAEILQWRCFHVKPMKFMLAPASSSYAALSPSNTPSCEAIPFTLKQAALSPSNTPSNEAARITPSQAVSATRISHIINNTRLNEASFLPRRYTLSCRRYRHNLGHRPIRPG